MKQKSARASASVSQTMLSQVKKKGKPDFLYYLAPVNAGCYAPIQQDSMSAERPAAR